MRRPWVYVASFVPFTTALMPSAKGSVADPEDEASRLRSKDGISGDDEGAAEGRGAQEIELKDIKHGVELPSASFSDVAGDDHGLNGGGATESQGPSQLITHYNGGMYQPSGYVGVGPISHVSSGGGGGGGVALATVSKTVYVYEDGAGNGGYIESDPEDADAMMIMLGGLAEGSGEGAESSGEVIFDIVDYGTLTVGYGYSTYMASGSEGASAGTFADAVGADLVFRYDTGNSVGTEAYSSSYILALDFEDEAAAGSFGEVDTVYWQQLLGQGPFAQWVVANAEEEEQDVSIDGNSAFNTISVEVHDTEPALVNGSFLAFSRTGSIVSTDATSEQAALMVHGEAQGIETLASATGTLLEIEDSYSMVGSTVIMIA